MQLAKEPDRIRPLQRIAILDGGGIYLTPVPRTLKIVQLVGLQHSTVLHLSDG